MNRLHHGNQIGSQDAKQQILSLLLHLLVGLVLFIGHDFALSNTMTRQTSLRMRMRAAVDHDSDRFQVFNFVDLLKSLDQQG